MSVFKAYDIRGKCPEQIDEGLARRIGRAFAEFLGNEGTIAVGHDMRDTSPGLARALEQGIHDGGMDTLHIGMVSTPTLYFVLGSRELQGGVMVTASHNPAGDNGFKLSREGVRPVGSVSGLKEIQAMVEGEVPGPREQRGKNLEMDVREAYLDHVQRLTGGEVGPLKVAFDCGNGVVGPTLEALLKRWPKIDAVKLFMEPDGTFPNHPANPIVSSNLEDVRRAVIENGCDLGVAFDGDGDRVVFIDEKGERVLSDLMTALLAGEVLEHHKGAAIVFDLVSSRVVREEVEKHGGRPVVERVGHAFIKKTMREEDAPFAGENSGHYYWRDHWFADSALVTLGKVLRLISAKKQPVSQLMAPLRRTAQSGERNYAVEDKDAALKELIASFPGEVDDMDGVSIRMEDWWFNARKSNTEPLLRLNVEAGSEEDLAEALRRLETILGGPVDH